MTSANTQPTTRKPGSTGSQRHCNGCDSPATETGRPPTHGRGLVGCGYRRLCARIPCGEPVVEEGCIIADSTEVNGGGAGDNEYDELYRETAASGGPPWDIGGPQPALARVLESGIRGPTVLDIGCGTGDLAIALARRGYRVTAIDISGVAIDMARAKAAREGLTVCFEVQDVTRMSLPSAPFDSVFDSGLLHSLSSEGGSEVDDYLALLPGLAAKGGTIVVLAVSLEAGQGWGVTEEFLREAFSEPRWVATQVDQVDVAAELGDRKFSLPGFLVRTIRAFDN